MTKDPSMAEIVMTLHVFGVGRTWVDGGGRSIGGGSGIRTHVTVSRKHAFQACAFGHSSSPTLTKARLVIDARSAAWLCERALHIASGYGESTASPVPK